MKQLSVIIALAGVINAVYLRTSSAVNTVEYCVEPSPRSAEYVTPSVSRTPDDKLHTSVASAIVTNPELPRDRSQSGPGYDRKLLQCAERKPWNEYLAEQEQYFRSNVTFLFSPGLHRMNRSLQVTNVSNLYFYGNTSLNVTLVHNCTKNGLSTPLVFSSFSYVTFEGLTFDLCTSFDDGLLSFLTGNNVSITDIKFQGACSNGSYIAAQNVKNIAISRVQFTKIESNWNANNPCGDICFHKNVSGIIQLQNLWFIDFPGTTLAQFSFINFGSSLVDSAFILIDNSTFYCKRPLTVNLGNASLTLNGINALGCHTNFLPAFHITTISGNCSIKNSRIEEYNYAIYVSTFNNSLLEIRQCVLQGNTIVEGSKQILQQKLASALSVYGAESQVFHLIIDVKFINNGRPLTNYTAVSSPTFLVDDSLLEIDECQFISNQGNALYIYDSHMKLKGTIYFANNTGFQGAALYLDTKFLIKPTMALITFENNQAETAGGAIYIANTLSACPFDEPVLSGIIFRNNNAGRAGDAIYGGNLDQALATKWGVVFRCVQILRNISVFKTPSSLSLISSNPSRVCLCKTTNPDCLQIFRNMAVFPGEEFTIPVVVVGQTFGTATGYVYAQLLLLVNVTARLGDLQHFQLVTQRHCNDLTYTLYSDRAEQVIVLVLTATSDLVEDYVDNSTVNSAINEYNKNNHSYVPKQLLNFPVYVNITTKPCPSGFKLTGSPPECRCIRKLQNLHGVKCHISKKQLERSGTVWIGFENNTNDSIVVFSKYCPYSFCTEDKVNIFMSPSSQCQYNHTGRLCGKCPNGWSLTLGKSQCRNCSSVHLYLIVPFAVGGVMLVIFIKVTDLTIANGLINGLILYANLVKANDYAFFTTTSNADYLSFLQAFVDWLNLDLGIETCFFDGMNGYWKTWLQFVFPIYIWAIALSMILLARYSMRMARLLGNNSVPVLATLFTLSYAKLFRTIITALTFTNVEDEQGGKSLAWSYDGTIDYLNLKHSLLFTVAVLVLLCLWLPYTCVLLFGQCLQRCNIHVISRLITRTKPFLDAHYGPFKDKHRYWFGMLLVARAVPLLIGVFTPISNEKITPLSTIAVVGALLVMNSRVYRKLYISLSEALFLLNLLFLAASALYTSSLGAPEDQKWFTILLVSIAFTQFIVILVFSALRHFRYDVCATRLERIPLLITINTSDLDELSFQRDSLDT